MYLEVFYEISKCISDISEILIVGVSSDIKEIRIFVIRKTYFLLYIKNSFFDVTKYVGLSGTKTIFFIYQIY